MFVLVSTDKSQQLNRAYQDKCRFSATSALRSHNDEIKGVSHIHESMCVTWGMLLRLSGLQAKQEMSGNNQLVAGGDL